MVNKDYQSKIVCAVLLTNWQLYTLRQDRHRHQRTFSHCSYHTFPLDHCGQATHRGWSPFLELEQFLPALVSLLLHRPFGTHCRTMSANSDTLATFKKRLKTYLFTASCEAFLPLSASAFLIMALY